MYIAHAMWYDEPMNVIEIVQVGTTTHVWVEVEDMSDEGQYAAMIEAQYAMGDCADTGCVVPAEVIAHADLSQVEILFN